MTKTALTLTLLSVFLASNTYAEERYNFLEDAAVSQAKAWQSGGKAKPIMSSDGKIIFAFGQSMPTLTCTPTRACDVELEPGERVQKKVILGDTVNWGVESAESMENGQTIQHAIFQPRDRDLDTNVIIPTDRRTYHIRLLSPHKEGSYLNRVGFYYPSKMVVEWKLKSEAAIADKQKDEQSNVLISPVSVDKLDFGYRMEGHADFAPIRVFNDGERTYFEMPDSLNTEENPVLFLRDEKDEVMMVNYRRQEDPVSRKVHYIVDKLFARAELKAGSETVQIIWKKKEKGFWKSVGLGRE